MLHEPLQPSSPDELEALFPPEANHALEVIATLFQRGRLWWETGTTNEPFTDDSSLTLEWQDGLGLLQALNKEGETLESIQVTQRDDMLIAVQVQEKPASADAAMELPF